VIASDASRAVGCQVYHARGPDKLLVSPPAGGVSLALLLCVLWTPDIIDFEPCVLVFSWRSRALQ
jgi:hypothetical protein